MTKRILISILSDYLQPNFLLIKEFEGKYDELAFITTQEMRGKQKGIFLEKALNLADNSIRRIEVVEDDFSNIKQALKNCDFSEDDEFILNVTGGTKVIPLAVCDFFKDYNSTFYYVPIGKNIICNIYTDEKIELNYRLTLEEYFMLNGLRYESDNTLLYPEKHTNELFEKFRQVKFKRYKINEFLHSQELATVKEKKYYSGAWFEEYCYLRLKKEQNLSDDAICKSAKIFRTMFNSKENDNEIDVMFVKENQLYVFECKVTSSGYGEAKDTIEKYLYKLAAISKDYGLRVNSYMLTLHNIFHNPNRFPMQTIENIQKRKSILGIQAILDCEEFEKPCLNITSLAKGDLKLAKTNNIESSNKDDVYTIDFPKIEVKVLGKIDLNPISKK